jgi:hypothetical protein
MSRGPGIWQRAIMMALQTRDVIYLRDVLPSPYTTAQRLACVRAAHQLAHGRKINLCNGPYKLDRSYQAFSGQSPLGVPVARPPQTRLE